MNKKEVVSYLLFNSTSLLVQLAPMNLYPRDHANIFSMSLYSYIDNDSHKKHSLKPS